MPSPAAATRAVQDKLAPSAARAASAGHDDESVERVGGGGNGREAEGGAAAVGTTAVDRHVVLHPPGVLMVPKIRVSICKSTNNLCVSARRSLGWLAPASTKSPRPCNKMKPFSRKCTYAIARNFSCFAKQLSKSWLQPNIDMPVLREAVVVCGDGRRRDVVGVVRRVLSARRPDDGRPVVVRDPLRRRL